MTCNAVIAELIDPVSNTLYGVIHMANGTWCGAMATGERAANGHRLWKPITRPARCRYEASVWLSEEIVPETLKNPVELWRPRK